MYTDRSENITLHTCTQTDHNENNLTQTDTRIHADRDEYITSQTDTDARAQITTNR